ncbi:DUF742 domain-containing protein [Nocardia uniformis]|uniref:DUF742 domain-containing protein n=1 Tax=Nocardia uniformis TaxID=53432 RepID=A0A849CE52_9NOCA|nr:DUF742 domain-containing protein [Nocardia uniformis]NNH74860.1 DUF742 domain-containing protein [Nocardia uniformis]
MNDPREHWYEEDAGPLVRLYAVTRGRGSAQRAELDMTTLVVADSGIALRRNAPEYQSIARFCRTAQSVAEVSAHLQLPLALSKVLIGDLIDDGYLSYRSPPSLSGDSGDIGILRAVMDGIRAL